MRRVFLVATRGLKLGGVVRVFATTLYSMAMMEMGLRAADGMERRAPCKREMDVLSHPV